MDMENRQTDSDIQAICTHHAEREAPLLPILHEVQQAYGFIPPSAIGEIAQCLNLSRAEVYGVVSFYTDFRQQAPRQHSLKVCRAEACQAMGGRAIWAAAQAAAADAACDVEVEAVYCLGNCPCAPSIQFDGRALGRLSPARIAGLIASAQPRSSS